MSHYELIASRHRELYRSPHGEFNPGGGLGDGVYLITADVSWIGFGEVGGEWNDYGAALGRPSYLQANYSASSAAGGSRSFQVNLDAYNGTPTSDSVQGAFGSTPLDGDINCAVLFALLLTDGTAISATELKYDDGAGSVASIVLSGPQTLGDMRNRCHALLNVGNFRDVPVVSPYPDYWMALSYATGLGPSGMPGANGLYPMPTLYSDDGSLSGAWHWGSGGLIPASLPTVRAPHVIPTVVKSNAGGSFINCNSAYQQYSGWQMSQCRIVGGGFHSPMYFRDDFTADPGPPLETTPQFPSFAFSGTLDLSPMGTVIDILARATQRSYGASRSFLHD